MFSLFSSLTCPKGNISVRQNILPWRQISGVRGHGARRVCCAALVVWIPPCLAYSFTPSCGVRIKDMLAYVHLQLYVCTVHVHVCVCVGIYACMRGACVQMSCMHVSVCEYIVYVHLHVCICMCICIHLCVYRVCTHVCVCPAPAYSASCGQRVLQWGGSCAWRGGGCPKWGLWPLPMEAFP